MSSLATTRGGLRVLAATVALVAFGLQLLRLGAKRQLWISDETLAALSGSGIVILTISLAACVWAALVLVGSLRWSWQVRAIVLAAIAVGAHALYLRWEVSYWENRHWRSADLITLASPSLEGTSWRGTTGGDCGYFSVFEVTFDSDSSATGRAVTLHSSDPLFTLAVVAGSTDKAGSRPIRAVLRHGMIYIVYPEDTYAYGPVVLNDPIPG